MAFLPLGQYYVFYLLHFFKYSVLPERKFYFSIAATPGNTLPSIASSIAPPPVET